MWISILWGLLTLVGGSAFVLIWWRLADKWADDEHKRFKTKDNGPAPKVVRRRAVEG
jgi:hypothetical protein